jgi:hypothetical protein
MADLPKVDTIWMDGEQVGWDAAHVHVLTHALHYGSGVFEGIRCYETPDGPAVFRLTDHMERLARSAKMMRMQVLYAVDEMVEATLALIKANGLPACYIRPLVYRGYGVAVGQLPGRRGAGQRSRRGDLLVAPALRQRVAPADQVDGQLHQLLVRADGSQRPRLR